MAKRQLGKTGIWITPIGLGVWQFAQGKGFNRFIWRAIDDGSQNAIIEAALEGGINWFDTAEAYGNGRSERGLAEGLQAAGIADGQVVIATKWFPLGRRAVSIGKTIADRLENLAPYHIDLHQVHNPYAFSSVEEQMDSMTALVHAGQIGAVGVSNFSAGQMLRAHSRLQDGGIPLASNQVKYSLLDRRIEGNGILETARALSITIIAYSPLEMGLLSGKFHNNPQRLAGLPLGRRLRLRRKLESSRRLLTALQDIGAGYGATPSQVALNWLIHFAGDTVVAIPGASQPRHASESAGAMSFELSSDELDQLDRLSQEFK